MSNPCNCHNCNTLNEIERKRMLRDIMVEVRMMNLETELEEGGTVQTFIQKYFPKIFKKIS